MARRLPASHRARYGDGGVMGVGTVAGDGSWPGDGIAPGVGIGPLGAVGEGIVIGIIVAAGLGWPIGAGDCCADAAAVPAPIAIAAAIESTINDLLMIPGATQMQRSLPGRRNAQHGLTTAAAGRKIVKNLGRFREVAFGIRYA